MTRIRRDARQKVCTSVKSSFGLARKDAISMLPQLSMDPFGLKTSSTHGCKSVGLRQPDTAYVI